MRESYLLQDGSRVRGCITWPALFTFRVKAQNLYEMEKIFCVVHLRKCWRMEKYLRQNKKFLTQNACCKTHAAQKLSIWSHLYKCAIFSGVGQGCSPDNSNCVFFWTQTIQCLAETSKWNAESQLCPQLMRCVCASARESPRNVMDTTLRVVVARKVLPASLPWLGIFVSRKARWYEFWYRRVFLSAKATLQSSFAPTPEGIQAESIRVEFSRCYWNKWRNGPTISDVGAKWTFQVCLSAGNMLKLSSPLVVYNSNFAEFCWVSSPKGRGGGFEVGVHSTKCAPLCYFTLSPWANKISE